MHWHPTRRYHLGLLLADGKEFGVWVREAWCLGFARLSLADNIVNSVVRV